MTEDGGAQTTPVGDIENVVRRLSEEFDLAAIDRMVDQTAASSMAESLPAALRQEMLVNYLGFAFWDVWTLRISEWHELEEHREIRRRSHKSRRCEFPETRGDRHKAEGREAEAFRWIFEPFHPRK